mmetsp:Transcript_16999/g.25594  ORF Transcript_16999/g.25594 Transcript_16999/m.25594 type:complete len:339 (+) Transcript_16999:27-1043(+)
MGLVVVRLGLAAGVCVVIVALTKRRRSKKKAKIASYCHDPNAEDSEVRQRLRKFFRLNPDNIHCVFDFDHTLTSSDSAQCHDHLALIDDEYMRNEMYKYLDFEHGGHPEIRNKPIQEWWHSVHGLIVKRRITWTKLKESLAQTTIRLRPRAEHALSALLALHIPVTVVSAGLEHVIDLVLRPWFKIASLDDPNVISNTPFTIHLVANRILFDHDSTAATVRPHPPVTAANKHCIYERLQPFFDSFTAARKHILLIGDSVGDVQAIAKIPHSTSLKIGFYNPKNPWAKRDAFDLVYDILIPHTASLDWLDSELRHLLPSPHFTPPPSTPTSSFLEDRKN